jgi:hypothetical protein
MRFFTKENSRILPNPVPNHSLTVSTQYEIISLGINSVEEHLLVTYKVL